MASEIDIVRRKSVADHPPLDIDLIRAHVARILTSPEFAAAPQLSVFLEYIVERKLAGEGNSLKAYTIATAAFGRAPNFDPQSDPIVRVQARRLRQSLQLYYAGPGSSETMRIVLPVGAYVPQFIDHKVAEPGAAPSERARTPMFPTPWVAPTALGLSIVSIIVNLWAMWPMIKPLVLGLLR